MKALKVKVENGKITGVAPPGLPEGELELVIADQGDDMTEEEVAELNREIEVSLQEIKAGQVISAEELLAKLRAKR